MPAAFHLRHLLISTGSQKWPHAIEKDEGSLASLIAEKRHEFPLRSKMAKAGILISNTTLPSSETCDVSSALLFPDNLYISEIPHSETEQFLETLLEENDEIRAIKLKENFGARDNTADVWLVCGHAERDARCGDIGPLILSEMDEVKSRESDDARDTKTALISHIGGHAFAGNVILFSGENGSSSWFGRVRPEHIQGLVKEWKDGRIVKELYRGSFAE
ncbi:Altered inheritance of mitochondria protein 32 [Yarrowia sp. E02]|nr:Altered inheritance of mitochondria protein 32 [Yarrowia sp. E02]